MNTHSTHTSILKSLRASSPNRACRFDEALSIAERQAAKLNQLLAAQHPGFQFTGITEQHIADLPRVRIVHEHLPVSGMSHWNGQEWIICLNAEDPEVRQRFTLLHEFKHIIDHGHAQQLYTGTPTSRSRTGATPHEQAERAADFFAGCALVPRTALKHAWGDGLQTPATLAEHFSVSEAAIHVRLDQTGLSRERDPDPEPPRARCQRPVRSGWGQEQGWRVARTR
jgi:Zn-dependent peptidase ImmA (M78 family)